MNKKTKLGLFFLLFSGVLLLGLLLFLNRHAAILNPQGTIASKQRHLIIASTLLMLIVVVPVYVMAFGIAWKYRESNKKQTKYSPDWDGHRLIESSWWAIPGVIILILAAITWKSSHELDPFRQLNSSTKPMTIQVVALQWKWLFIYPEQKIASVNTVHFPTQTPVDFEITSDAPMNSFWIPQLGGQVYAMSGMATQLHLMATQIGNFRGSSANISGKGFAGMHFTARSTSKSDFENWVQQVKQTPNSLSFEEYNQLAKPTENNQIAYYSPAQNGLFDQIISKYMAPSGQMAGMGHMHTASRY